MIRYIITKLTQHSGFMGYIKHSSTLESIDQLEEYKLYCEAHDEKMSIEGYLAYLQLSVKGGS